MQTTSAIEAALIDQVLALKRVLVEQRATMQSQLAELARTNEALAEIRQETRQERHTRDLKSIINTATIDFALVCTAVVTVFVVAFALT